MMDKDERTVLLIGIGIIILLVGFFLIAAYPLSKLSYEGSICTNHNVIKEQAPRRQQPKAEFDMADAAGLYLMFNALL